MTDTPQQVKDPPDEADVLDTMAGEIAEAVELMRPHFPDSDEASLRRRAEGLRWYRYQEGCWSDFAEVAREEATEAAVFDASVPASLPMLKLV